jgi:hypothetical protein
VKGAKMSKTTKKVKVIGTETYINQRTGELQDMQVVSIEDRDFNFHKIWLEHIIQSIDMIGNQKMRLAFWMLDHMNVDNQITMTQRQMSEKSGISLSTVQETIKTLIGSNFLVKYNWGVYQVNPDVIFKGGKQSRMNILFEYKRIEENKTKESKLEVLEKAS